MVKQKVTVASYVEQQLAVCGRTQKEIAEELGYENPNMISMLKKGNTKVPLNRVYTLAKAMGVDPKFFLRMVMTEYMPDTWAAISLVYGDQMVLADQEIQLVQLFRKVTGGLPVDLELPENVDAITSAFDQVAKRDQAKAKASVARMDKLPPNSRHK